MSMTAQQFTDALESGKYAWPGGYETHFIMADYETICFDCANTEKTRILSEIKEITYADKQWLPIEQSVHWEGEPLICAHCNRDIESAYGVPE